MPRRSLKVLVGLTALAGASAAPAAQQIGLVCTGINTFWKGQETRHYVIDLKAKKIWTRDEVTGELSLPYRLSVNSRSYSGQREEDSHNTMQVPIHRAYLIEFYREDGGVKETATEVIYWKPKPAWSDWKFQAKCKPENPRVRKALKF